MNHNDILQIFKDAKNDSSLLGTLNIQELLESSKTRYLEEKSLQMISDDIFHIVQQLQLLSSQDKQKIFSKLTEYRHVDEIYKLHRGKYLRWIDIKNNQLTNGGFLLDVKFLDTGLYILCKNTRNQLFQYKFDDCYTFQKLSDDEIMILLQYV